MSDENIDLNKSLIDLYLKNLDFLKQNHSHVYEKINKLSNDIESQNYKEKYHLEFVNQKYFDILNVETNEFLYNFDSFLEAEKRSDLVTKDEKHSINLLRKDISSNKFLLLDALTTSKPLVNFINENINLKDINFKKLYKFVYIGVGTGVHLHEIDKKISSMNTLIIEPSIEVFRLSLFLVDYSNFESNNRKLFLTIGEDEFERRVIFRNFYDYHDYMNYNVKYHLFKPEQEYLLDELINFFRISPLDFAYHMVSTVFKRTVHFMKKDYNFIKNDLLQKNLPFKDKKVLIIAAGPSVDKQIEWIKKNQNKFIIICVDKILQKLELHNIVPDIVLSIDPLEKIKDFFVLKNKDFLKNSTVLLMSQQHDLLIKEIEHLNFYFVQVFPISKELDFSITLPNVGLFSLAVSLFFGSKDIYITGNDAAFDNDTGKTYADNTLHKMIKDLDKSIENTSKESVSDFDIIETKGNLKETVKSNKILIEFKHDFETFINLYKNTNPNDFKIFNLSEGAYIEGFTPLEISKIEVKDFEEKNFNCIESLNNISDTVDNLDFDKDTKIINSIISKIKKFQKIKISSEDDFQDKKIELMVWVLEQKKEMSNPAYGKIFLKFTSLIDIYINFTLNLSNQKNIDKVFLTKLKNHWCTVFLDLIKDIKSSINE